MNPYQTSYDSGSRIRSIILLIVVVIAVVVGGASSYYFLISKDKEIEKTPALESFGLLEGEYQGDRPTGQLLFTTSVEDGLDYLPVLQSAPVDDLSIRTVVLTKTVQDYQPLSGSIKGILSQERNSEGLPSWKPELYDILTNESQILPHEPGVIHANLSFSSDGDFYAYSFLSALPVVKSNENPLKAWSIAVHDRLEETSFIIPSAHEPKWIPNQRAFLYVTVDGIFLYDLDTAASTVVFDKYKNLSVSDDIAISPDGSVLILTVPTLNAISILRNITSPGFSGFAEESRLVIPNTALRHPVIDPSGQFYAVVAFDETKPTPLSIQIRPISHRHTVAESFVTDTKTITLTNWHINTK